MTGSVEMILWFMVKHFICDFPLQAFPYMYKNKGTYGHLGGLLHAHIHGLGTLIVLSCFGVVGEVLGAIVMLDIILHYHIDYAKMKIGRVLDLRPDNSEWFWILLGFDQLLHFLCYYFFTKLI